ncbi:MAG: CHAD domain-containing protein [Acidobacteria bacterium]|nr:CHAD domain-containing protein [Acidobacteriota bacterium]
MKNGVPSPTVTADLPEPHETDATAASSEQPLLTLEQIITNQFVTLQHHLAAALTSDDVVAIHKLRVTTRKLQASLDLLQFDDAGAEVKKVKKGLRNLRRKLSAVRNYDVFLDLLQQEAESRRALHHPFKFLGKALQHRRAESALQIAPVLRALQVKQLAKALGLKLTKANAEGNSQAVSEAKSRSKFARYFAEDKILQHTANRLDQRLAEFLLLTAQVQPTTHPEELHQLRIAAKRLRYLLEIAAEMGYGESLAALRWLRALQDKIGDWHDLEALESEIINIAGRRKFIRKHLEEASAILVAAVHLQKKKQTLAQPLFPIKVPKTLARSANRVANSLHQASQSEVEP